MGASLNDKSHRWFQSEMQDKRKYACLTHCLRDFAITHTRTHTRADSKKQLTVVIVVVRVHWSQGFFCSERERKEKCKTNRIAKRHAQQDRANQISSRQQNVQNCWARP